MAEYHRGKRHGLSLCCSNISADKSENNMDTSQATEDCWLVKLDSAGNIGWQNTIGGNLRDMASYSVQQTADMGYILCLSSYSNISGDKTENNMDTTLASADYWIVKTDSSGNIQCQNT